jgi:hypothetical protein
MLLASNEGVAKIYKLRPDRVLLVNEETGHERYVKTGFLFSQIMVPIPTKELSELFPPRKEGGLLGGHKGTSERLRGTAQPLLPR